MSLSMSSPSAARMPMYLRFYARVNDALRAQMAEQASQTRLEPPHGGGAPEQRLKCVYFTTQSRRSGSGGGGT